RRLRPFDHPGRPARDLAGPHFARPGRRLAPSPSGRGGGKGDEGADQDAVPDRALHLPGDVHRHPRPGPPQPHALPQMSPETEHRCGTGLRAQLQRKQGEVEPEVVAEALPVEAEEPELEPRFEEAPAPPVLDDPFDDGFDDSFDDPAPTIVQAPPPELAEVRGELEDALRREQQLRDALQHHIEAHERELEAGRELALREAEVEQASARVAARDSELQDRERRLEEQHEYVASDRRELNLYRTELVAEEARLAQLGVQVDAKTADLETADVERAEHAPELARQLRAVAERERELKRERTELDQRRAETIAREDALRTRDEAGGARERDLRTAELEIERVQARLQERVEAVAARESSTVSRLTKLEAELTEREAALAAWEERVRSQADRAERERAAPRRAAHPAFALTAQLHP